MAIRASREVVIDAPPEAIMDALADIEAVPSWSSVHKRAEVIDTYADGRPHHVKVTAKLMGSSTRKCPNTTEVPTGWSGMPSPPIDSTASTSSTRFNPKAAGRACASTSRWSTNAPLFEFLIKRGEKIMLDAATEGLRKRVLG